MDFTSLNDRQLASGIVFPDCGLPSTISPDQEKGIEGTTNNQVEMKENLSNKSDSFTGGMINGKEKSPMCLVNELCRFNSITCRYELIEESGAPHSRTFFVLLRLGDKEEYRASAPSIRKAQHAAASLALISTRYPQPSPKSERKVNRCNSQLTPTVELNVLAMKRREPVQYHVYEQPIRPNLLSNLMPFNSSVGNQVSSSPGDLHDYRNLYHQRYHIVRGMMTPWFVATVMVGTRQFSGKGKTIQIARHAAAEEALKTIRQLPLPTPSTTTIPVTTNSSSQAVSSLVEVDADDDDIKSPVSMIYEAAMKRKYLVQFDVISESGPSHMPCFVIKCTVGNYSAEGRGVRKKTAKRRAAAAVLAELEEKEPIHESSGQPKSASNDSNNLMGSSPIKDKTSLNRSSRRRPIATRPKRNGDQSNKLNAQIDELTVKLQNSTLSSETDSINCPKTCSSIAPNTQAASPRDQVKFLKTSFTLNPISRLIQLQMAKKEDEPRFKLISEIDIEHRRKEFTIQCSINFPKNSRFVIAPTISNELKTFGFGPNKRIAKRNSAEEMLKILGYSSSTTITTKTNLSSSSSTSSSCSMTSSSLSPILKMSNLHSPTESTQNTDSEINHTNLQLARPLKGGPVKERHVKFMENSRDNVQTLTERLETLSGMTQQQLASSSSDTPNKCGRQIAPGLLFVMSMNQSSGGYPMELMDNTKTVDKL